MSGLLEKKLGLKAYAFWGMYVAIISWQNKDSYLKHELQTACNFCLRPKSFSSI